MTAPKPRTADELQLEETQKAVTIGLLAEARKRELLLRLFDKGMTQAELAERLTRASVAAGGGKITVNSVFKVISKYRRKLEQGAA